MVATIELEIPAKRPCVPLPPLEAFADSPSALRLVAVPPPMGDWHVTAVRLSVVMPSGQAHGLAAVREGNAWIVTIPACAAPGEVRGGWTVYADGMDENGAAFANLALGRGDVHVIPADGAIAPGEEVRFMHLVYERPASPREGDVYQGTDGWEIYKGGAWIPLGGGTTDYNDLSNKPAIGGVTLSGNKTAADLGLATLEEVSELAGEVIAKYTMPQGGIPASDMAQEVQTSLNKANTALQTAPVTSVNNKTGAVALDASDVGAPSVSELDARVSLGLPFELPEQFLPIEAYVVNVTTDFWLTIDSQSDFIIVEDSQCYYLQYFDKDTSHGYDMDSPDRTIKLAAFDKETLQFDRYHGDAGTITFNGLSPYMGDEVYIVRKEDSDDAIPAIYSTIVAPLASPAFTGTPTAPTPTQNSGDAQIANKKYVDDAVSGATPNLDYVMRVDPETGGIYYTTPDTNDTNA